MPDSRLRAYENGVAEANAAKKQIDAIRNLQSSNKLAKYGPFWCLYAIIVFVLWCIGWFFNIDKYGCVFSQSLLNVIGATNGSNGVCVESITKPVFDDISFRTFSFFSSGTFAASFITQLIQLTDSDIKNSIRAAPVYCTAVVNLISFMCHLSMALGWSPVVVSPFGRVTHVARWGAWVSLVPLMMVMMHAIDLKTEDDVRYMWLSTALQQVSVLTGGVASMTPNVTVAVVMLTFSFASYAFIFYDLHRSWQKYKVTIAESKARRLKTIERNSGGVTIGSNKGASTMTKNSSSSNSFAYSRENNGTSQKNNESEREQDAKAMVNDVIVNIETVSTVMSTKLTLACAVSWTLIVLVYTLGMFNLISCETECIWQSAMDILAKCVYQQALCTSHGTSLSPEGILSRMLLLEEQANASIRQFLRFICHEVSTPLNTVVMGLQQLQDVDCGEDVKEIVLMAQDSCSHISETLKDLRHFQEVEEGSVSIQLRPLNFKSLLRSVSNRHVVKARTKEVILLLAIDPRIPDVLMGERVRLKQVMTILINNGIELARRRGTCTVLAELKNNMNHDSSTATVRLAVRDDGDGFNASEASTIFKPYSRLTPGGYLKGNNALGINICVAKQIVELHGGVLGVDTAPEKGSTFYFDIPFTIPSFTNESLAYLTAEILTTNTDENFQGVYEEINLTSSRQRLVHARSAIQSPPKSDHNKVNFMEMDMNSDTDENSKMSNKVPFISPINASIKDSVTPTRNVEIMTPMSENSNMSIRSLNNNTSNNNLNNANYYNNHSNNFSHNSNDKSVSLEIHESTRGTAMLVDPQVRSTSATPNSTTITSSSTIMSISCNDVDNTVEDELERELAGINTDKKSMTMTMTNQKTIQRQLTAIVVDDVPTNRKLLQKTMERLGFVVDSVEDGDELVDLIIPPGQKLIQKYYDVIILDNVMLRVSGVDAAKILRDENYTGVIIGVTGNVLDNDLREFQDAGCNAVLSKPLNMNTLRKVLISQGLSVN